MKTKKGLKFITGVFCMAVMILGMMKTDAYAAGTVTVTADKASAAIGETVNVTVQTSEPEDPATVPEVSVTYNSDILDFVGCNVEFGGGGGLVTFVGQSAILTFTAAQTGTVSVGAEAIIDDDGASPATGSALITVGASTQGGLSSDATLYVLEMNPGEMVPAFSSDVTEYQIVIGNDVTDITVSGAVSDPGAQITAASGFKNLKEGTNQAVITVTAADGSMLTYHFTIVRGETAATQESEDETAAEEESAAEQTSDGLNVTIDNANYTVQSVIPEEFLPEGCVKSTSTFNSKPVEAALFEKGGLTLLYALPSGSDSGDFFVYNEATGKLLLFVQIYNIENRYIIPIEAQDTPPAQFAPGKMQWNGFSLPAFVLADSSVEKADVFYLLYAVSNEGERGFYLYDTVEGTYQRFLNYTGAKAADTATADGGFGKTAIIVIAVLALLLAGAIMLIVNMIVRNKEQQEFEPKPVPKKPKPEPKPAVKKVLPQPTPQEEESAEKRQEKPAGKQVMKAKTAPQPTPEKPAATETPAAVPQPQPQVRETPVQPTVRPRQTMHTDHVVTMQPRQVEGAVGITGKIPVKVVPTPKSEVRRPSVPIFTLEKPTDGLDDDFEFEFINIDND